MSIPVILFTSLMWALAASGLPAGEMRGLSLFLSGVWLGFGLTLYLIEKSES